MRKTSGSPYVRSKGRTAKREEIVLPRSHSHGEQHGRIGSNTPCTTQKKAHVRERAPRQEKGRVRRRHPSCRKKEQTQAPDVLSVSPRCHASCRPSAWTA